MPPLLAVPGVAPARRLQIVFGADEGLDSKVAPNQPIWKKARPNYSVGSYVPACSMRAILFPALSAVTTRWVT
jgi:hypothetical protein